MLLALTMLPAVGIQSAYADEPAARPVTTGGDTALTGFEGDGAAASAGASAATQRDDGTLAVDGLVYAVTDSGLALVGFDGPPEGEDAVKDITVPASVSVDGKDTPVVAVDIAEGQTADSVVSLTLPQSVNNVNTVTLAAAFPNLAAIEIAAPKASAPVAAGAAAIRAAYSSFGGILYRNAWVATDGDASQTTLTKELVWAPPATVVARIPVECTSIAASAFADVKDLKTVVCFGVMADIAQTQKADDGTVTPGAFTDEQIQTVNVIVPQTGTVVPDGDHVSASVAVTDDSTMDIKREAWWKSGFASDRITLGEVYGSTTNTLPVTEDGTLETAEAEVAYAPETTQNSSSRKAGIEPPASAIPTPVPDDDELDASESGLVFTHLADMTLSVSWKGDPTATPAHLEIPAYATINGVTYPVTEIAPNAFEGAVFLTSINIPETIKVIGEGAFEGCDNLAELELPATLELAAASADRADLDWDAEPTPAPISNGLLGNDEVMSYSDYYPSGTIILTCNEPLGKSLTLYDDTISTPLPEDLKLYRLPRTLGTATLWTAYAQRSSAEYYPIYFNSMGVTKADDGTTQMNDYGGYLRKLNLRSINSFFIASVEITPIGTTGDLVGQSWNIDVTVLPYGTLSANNHITKDVTELTNFYSKTDADSRFALTEGNATESWVTANFLTKAATELDNFYDKAAFNTIGYTGLEDASYIGALPTFYVNDAAKLPTVPEPRRDGYEFSGWTWSDGMNATKDASGAFSAGGPVTLTAHWDTLTPEANYFFTEKDSYKGGDDSHKIAVRLSTDEPAQKQVSVTFSRKDGAPFVSDGAGIQFKVGSKDSIETGGTWLDWESQANATVVPLDGGGWGLYVKVHVPDGAVAPSTVSSYVDSSYVATFATMRYTFAS